MRHANRLWTFEWHTTARAQLATRGAVLLIATTALLTSCTGDNSTAPSSRSSATTLGSVTVSPLNAIMTVGDTMTLTTTARTLTGGSATALDSVEYLLQNVADSIRVRISPSGTVTALGPSSPNSPVMVQVMGFKDGLVRADVAVIQVTQTAVPGVTLSIQPIAPDSNRVSIGRDKYLPPTIQNALGDQVTGAAFRYEYGVGDSATMLCYTPTVLPTATVTSQQLVTSACGGGQLGLNAIHGNAAGVAWVIASARVYGVTLRDSVQYVVTNPYLEGTSINATNLAVTGISSNTVIIAPGGSVYFINGFQYGFDVSITIAFENPEAATTTDPPSDVGGISGNITTLQTGDVARRRFLTAGTYKWTATLAGGVPPFTGATTTGQVIVQ